MAASSRKHVNTSCMSAGESIAKSVYVYIRNVQELQRFWDFVRIRTKARVNGLSVQNIGHDAL